MGRTMNSVVLRIFFSGTIALLMLAFFGCGEKPTRSYRDGRLWVVNNFSSWDPAGRWLTVEWEGEVISVDNNMDYEGNPTGVGAVLITPEPLPGGTVVDFTFNFKFGNEVRTRRLSELLPSGQKAIIDGDITIEVYSLKWDPRLAYNDAAVRVVSGKFDGVHPYPELQ